MSTLAWKHITVCNCKISEWWKCLLHVLVLVRFHKTCTSQGQYFRKGSPGNGLWRIKWRKSTTLRFHHDSLSPPLKTQRWNTFPYLESRSYRSHNLHRVSTWFYSDALRWWGIYIWDKWHVNRIISCFDTFAVIYTTTGKAFKVPVHTKRAKYLFWLERRRRNVRMSRYMSNSINILVIPKVKESSKCAVMK